MADERYAPGWPGIPPRWTSSAKTGVGTAPSSDSAVWFTISHGILDEIYYPRVDQACTRDMGLIVTAPGGFFSEEKRHTLSVQDRLGSGVPAYRLINTCRRSRFRIEKEILTDPLRDCLLQHVRFDPLRGAKGEYRVHVLLAPHLGNHGYGNTGWVGDYHGVPMLFAERGRWALALACSAPWAKRSVGFVGVSDAWQDLVRHGQMEWEYTRAENGNIALAGQIDLEHDGTDSFVLALGFGANAAEAGQRARQSLIDSFDTARRNYVGAWQAWQQELLELPEVYEGERDLRRVSMAVIRTHEAAHLPGGVIASLSIPWGFTKGDDDLGGYHLVWPRDLVEAVGGLLAGGAPGETQRVFRYLQATQYTDGHWPQNMWLDGTPYWDGLQMDEISFPILLVALARRYDIISEEQMRRLYPMIRNAAGFVARCGPATQQDRWEENSGYSPYTLAVEISALLVAAELAQEMGEGEVAQYLRATADTWNANIERWTYVEQTDLAHRFGVDGYYVRIAPANVIEGTPLDDAWILLRNHPLGQGWRRACDVVSPDMLGLVHFGLRRPDDPRIVNTLKVIDGLLKVETPTGPAWHRYNGDGYGEHADGAPYDGTGIGRAWPLLTGERAHYELAAGRRDEAIRLLKAFESFTRAGDLIPEQIWDAPDIPSRELCFGEPSGSATPLVWAHAVYVKLRRSLHEGAIFDQPPETAARYLKHARPAPYGFWRFNHKSITTPKGRPLRIELLAPATVHWSPDGWKTARDCPTYTNDLGIYLVDLPIEGMPDGAPVSFTFYWPEAQRWEGADFTVTVREED